MECTSPVLDGIEQEEPKNDPICKFSPEDLQRIGSEEFNNRFEDLKTKLNSEALQELMSNEFNRWFKALKVHIDTGAISTDTWLTIFNCTHGEKAVPENLELYNKLIEIQEWGYLPGSNAVVAWRGLFLLYKRFCPKTEMNFSTQSAGMVRTLKELGFIFHKGKGRNREYLENGIWGRKIVDWSPPDHIHTNPGIKISSEEQKQFLKKKRCVITNSRLALEVDHRLPVVQARERNLAYKILTSKMVENGSWIADFQILTKTINMKKKSVCNDLCQHGDRIEILDSVYCKRIYAQFWHDTKDCVGCFWYDKDRPLNEKNFRQCSDCTIPCHHKGSERLHI